nr:NACHT domain-containing protein [Glycomyces sp. L485]
MPIGDLAWSDAERLFLRLLHTIRPVQYAKLFGTPGQAQAGIDAYARLPLDLTRGESEGRDYITLQSRRIMNLTAAKIKKAVDDLLKGEWADKTAAFYFATSFDLQDTKLDAAIREQTERLERLQITFVPWGVQEVSSLLKDHPRIVDDFFGRPWVERFCGPEAARALSDNLPHQDSRELRAGLRDLYGAVFSAQGGVHPVENPGSGAPFIILDVDPNCQRVDHVDTEEPEPVVEEPHPTEGTLDADNSAASWLGSIRQSLRSAGHLLKRKSLAAPVTAGTIAADEWLASGKYRLLIGRPGAGKSSLLRFIATDLLSTQPQSIELQREHADNLPIWLPFGFLCRHLEESTEKSLISAAEAWLSAQSTAHLWPLVERALRDDRLLLLVDGVDEWSSVRGAERALAALEGFLGHSQASAILSTRPYAVGRLNWSLRWEQAELTPLTDRQRRAITAEILRPATPPEAETGVMPPWSASVESFLDQVEATRELSELSRIPLFLTLLATKWQGEPLPRQRFKIYTRLVELLVEKHPQMRQRASYAKEPVLDASNAAILFAAVAYRLRVGDPSGTVTKARMRKLIVESMIDDEVLGYPEAEARSIADDVLAMASDEFGLIVSHGAGTFGFLHRVVLDHLAGQYLATQPTSRQVEAIQELVHDPTWRDVILALLSAQVNPHDTERLLSEALDESGQEWADIDGFELLAESLAAGVRLMPKSQASYVGRLVNRVERHPSLRHRANLLTALTATLANQMVRGELLPVMKRWLTAPRPNPAPSMWALRDLAIPDNVAAERLFWGLRHPEDEVKINAAVAIGRRFGGQSQMMDRLVALTESGPSSGTQAAAILALGEGWSDASETARLIDWARRQPSKTLRLASLHVLQTSSAPGNAGSYRQEEREWLLTLLHREDIGTGAWPVAALVNLAAAGDAAVADFALETLETNGQDGGDRALAWYLACNAFEADGRFKSWTAAKLANPEDRGLILYDIGLIPQRWRDDPAFAEALRLTIEAGLGGLSVSGAADLAIALPSGDAKAVLLDSLDKPRPYAAARRLVEHYLDDAQVRAALADRLHGDFATAAPMAGVAIDVLGPQEGFAVLVSLLRHIDENDSREGRVVVAESAAVAWKRFLGIAAEQGPPSVAAQEVLASYDASELAVLCTSVDPSFLMWHVPAVISAWPEQPAVQEFAGKTLSDTRPISSGIPDTIPSAILRTYCGRTDPSSQRILDQTLDLLAHLEPELREVLTFELARSSLTAADLVDLLADWKNEPDPEVRRTALVGLVQAIKSDQQAHNNLTGPDTFTPQMEWLHHEIKDQLCAYGPELEERRRLAWIGMLILGDLTLIDGIKETIGAPDAPGVQLDAEDYGPVDRILVELIAENWARLSEHFSEQVFDRLNGKLGNRNQTANDKRRNVMSALAIVASRYPDIADMIRREADNDDSLRKDRRFLLWAKHENNGSEEVLRALASRLGIMGHHWSNQALDSILDRDSWNVPDDLFKAILTEGNRSIGLRGHYYADEQLAAYTQLFPTDPVSVVAIQQLEEWFQTDPSNREHRGWGDTLAIALGAAGPDDLPAIATRADARIRMGLSDLYLPMFTRPLTRRLRVDLDAVEAFKAALSDPMGIREGSPIFASPWDPVAQANPESRLLQRMYLFAVALRHVGALPQAESAQVTRILESASPDTVVYNPFTNHEGPLRLAALDLRSTSL